MEPDNRNDTPPPPAESPFFRQARSMLPRNLEIRAALLLALTLLLMTAFLAYVLYARGFFEHQQSLILVTDDSTGVAVGMDMTYAGFPVGRVARIRLADDGKVHIQVQVPDSEARWLRVSSVFTLESGLIGATRLRAYSGDLSDSPLPDGAVRPVLRGDASEEIPRLLATMKEILGNVDRMTEQDSSLDASLASVRELTARMAGRGGVLAGVLGTEENARKVIGSIDRANALLDSVSGVSKRMDELIARADRRVLGDGGVMDEAQKAVVQLNAALGEARTSLKRVDGLLSEAQKIAVNTRAATDDLAALRAEVEASLRRVSNLIEEINRKWPFARETEVKLP